ncbi:hypothetical protein B0J11DRAFT_146271 [Dendryphion nanum]|uniref:Uncharacterized protein n=1 Tax=Dendryphion nanum TaxID=256645 RepID=A0A9P9D634_9PLEO|nr:hypothetical protein B0J11DRAFT_146271 [Dendryphion nanum]
MARYNKENVNPLRGTAAPEVKPSVGFGTMGAGERLKHEEHRWILPKYLTLTQEARRLASVPSYTEVMESSFASYLSFLIGPAMAFEQLDDQATISKAQKLYQKYPDVKDTGTTLIVHYSRCLDALHYIGLDIFGGLPKIIEERADMAKKHSAGFGTCSVIVRDYDRAHVYVELGLRLHPAALLHAYPSSLEEAVKFYHTILELINPGEQKQPTLQSIDEEMRATTDQHRHWVLERAKVRLRVKEEYRQVLIDMAMDANLSEVRDKNKKRKRQLAN